MSEKLCSTKTLGEKRTQTHFCKSMGCLHQVCLRLVTEGWNIPQSDGANYNRGGLYEEDTFTGNNPTQQTLPFYQ